MQIPILKATSYQKTMISGRTKPCLFFCEDEGGNNSCEYIVKLKAGMENGYNGLIAEVLASQLAQVLDIPTPEPALIYIDPLLAEAVSDTNLSEKIRNSAGLNFGSKVITCGYDTWPVGKAIPTNLRILASEIFAFDALIQNPDRRVDKPNILWKGDELYIIDHEMGFSFIYEILPSASPWQVNKLGFLKRHLFYAELKGHPINLERFAGAIDLLTDNVLNEMVSNIPPEWQNNNISKITTHLKDITNHVNEFIDEIRRTLQ